MSQTKPASDRIRSSGRSLDTRERILRDAAALFSERGFHGTSVRDIAARVGVLSGSLFHHFESKESILAAIAREAALSLCLGAEAAVHGVADPVARLRILVRFQLDAFTSARRDFYAVLTREWRHVPAPDQGELRALRRRYFAFSRRIIDDCDAVGRIRVPADAAHRIVNSVTVDATTWFRPDGRYGIDQFAEIVASLVLEGAPAPRGPEPRTRR